MLHQKIKFLVIILSCLTLVSCFQYKEVEMLGVTDFGIKKISTKGITLAIAMQIKNPNNYKISIVKSDLVLFSKGRKIGTANIANKIVLPKKSNQIHQFIVVTTIKDMASKSLPLLMSILSKNAIELQIKGNIKARAKGLSKKIPIDFKKRMKL